MAVKVVDASALAALLFGEPDADVVAERLNGAALIAPALLDFELASVCVSKCRRHVDHRDALMSGYHRRWLLDIEIVAVDHCDVLELASRTGLTAYDASYLWVAGRYRAELVTLDRQLQRACEP